MLLVAQCDGYQCKPPSNDHSRSLASLSVVSGSPSTMASGQDGARSPAPRNFTGAYALCDLNPQKNLQTFTLYHFQPLP